MKLFTNQKVARYVAAPMIGLSILGGTALGVGDFTNPLTGDPGTSQTISSASVFGNDAA
ncbi:hypothetical protein [Mycobacterium sp. MS1601]|uniref:hypothetical protein n=1 Tax=Mycobacterium sp. MS1601 TaxID=1936029 RepID=UPI0012F83550|nr:hypothetical protein [Mycobacterium sp. MS1601]